MNIFKVLLIKVFLLASLSSVFPSVLASDGADNDGVRAVKTIVVQGKASVTVEPDQINFVIGVDARAPTAGVAYKKVEQKMQEIMAVLAQYDIPHKNVQAMDLSIMPVIDYERQRQIIAHDAKRNIAVSLTDIDQYAAIMESLGSLDVMRFEKVQLASSQHAQLSLQALEAAYKNAEKKAQLLAKASDRKLIGLIDLKEQSSRGAPVFSARMAMASHESSATTSKGSIGVESSVMATFQIE
ncbi:MAG: SIMPL domain-containing protein [Pseudomonadales bacterium]|nr:SIMPL domain-containing protein [Pseudomonadales bacterium]